jgi:hypothetical protein
MAVGTFTISITAVPITNSLTPDYTGRSIVAMAVPMAMQAFMSTAQLSGNIVWPPGGSTPTVIGTWTYVPPT